MALPLSRASELAPAEKLGFHSPGASEIQRQLSAGQILRRGPVSPGRMTLHSTQCLGDRCNHLLQTAEPAGASSRRLCRRPARLLQGRSCAEKIVWTRTSSPALPGLRIVSIAVDSSCPRPRSPTVLLCPESHQESRCSDPFLRPSPSWLCGASYVATAQAR